LTTLDAVNNMLLAINEQPVPVVDEAIAEVKIALSILEQTKDLVLSEGWHFNSESNVELFPDTSGNIFVPQNAMYIEPTDKNKNYIAKEGKLYNKTDHTFIFKTSVKVNIIYNLDFEDLPIYAQKYISEKAARIYIAQTFGDPQLYQYQSQEEYESYRTMVSHEVDSGDYNMLNTYRGNFNG